ncbi:unnamed protein product, partial [marine sediment metagenome]
MEKLGASLNASINAVFPLFGALLAVILLKESPTAGIWIGTIFIIFGAILIERSINTSNNNIGRFKKVFLVFPLFAALMTGSSQVIRKMGLNIYDEPIIGLAIG